MTKKVKMVHYIIRMRMLSHSLIRNLTLVESLPHE